MTQFIPVTIDGADDRVRLNVAAISHYPGNEDDRTTTINLINGRTMRVTESAAALDELIRNITKAAVLSAG